MTTPDRNPPGISSTEPDDLNYIVHHAALPETGFSRAIDGAIKRFGSFMSWFWVALLAVICVNVFMKNALGQGSVQFEEIQWHIYAALFLIGLSYTMAYDDHVRVDILYENFSLKAKAWVDTLGIIFFLIPFLLLMIYYSWPFVLKAYTDHERSSSPAGLSNYWIIKSVLILGLSLLLLTAIARLHRCVAFLRGATSVENGGAR
ncbi:TRAP transporter small permease subunit [Acuticoccus kandeliae]|uniref:TRAP transporter small permease subunit n=1 Tax=Acuticoccus kandeliae TaxID=2073160 RepID=UPI0013009F58|nr:TRAP transporter small permease subunit [Acuticoccus kandeliae]